MFKSKIVFILGAGSSAEVGLPVGEGLKEIISQKLKPTSNLYEISPSDPDIRRAITNEFLAKGLREEASRAIGKLLNGLPLAASIDTFLHSHNDDPCLQKIGKFGIIKSILEAEYSSLIYCAKHHDEENKREIYFKNDRIKNSWFAKFFNLLVDHATPEERRNIFSNVSIVNFNYDRCIQHYLLEALKNYYDIDESIAISFLKPLKIFHPYGSVGKLPWQEGTSLPTPFGCRDLGNFSHLSEGIKTFNESSGDTGEIEEIRNVVQQAQIIVFLGFAFHGQNLDLIKPTKACAAKKIFATALGISNRDCDVIKRRLNQMFRRPLEIYLDGIKCGKLLDDYSLSLTE